MPAERGVKLTAPTGRDGQPLNLPPELLAQLQAAMEREQRDNNAPPPTLNPVPPGGSATPGYLGAKITDLKDGAIGVLVMEVVPDGPAAVATGLKKDDIIVSINGEPVETHQQLSQIISESGPGSRLTLVVLRAGQMRKAAVTLGTRPAPAPPAPALGPRR